MVKFQNYAVVDGIKYPVDNKNVILKPSKREIEVAQLLKDKLGGNVTILPAVKNIQNRKSADYKYRREKYDLKGVEGKEKTTVYNAIHTKKTQATNFIVDRTGKTPLSRKQIREQIGRIFSSDHTRFVDKVIFTENDKILNIYQRRKK